MLVVLLESSLDPHAERDMRRWWHDRCKKHFSPSGEVYFEVAPPVRFNCYEGAKRLRSFGVQCRVARRTPW